MEGQAPSETLAFIYYGPKKTQGRQKSEPFARKTPGIQTLALVFHIIFHININGIINND